MFDHDPGDKHYSSLSQITPENVTTLKRAWRELTAYALEHGIATTTYHPPLSRPRRISDSWAGRMWIRAL